MKAAVCYGSGQPIVIEERPDPTPDNDTLVIEVERCGICGSELHINDGGGHSYPEGMIMGHEYSGRIIETGNSQTTLAPGDRVAVFPAVGCGQCEACSEGNWILCPHALRIQGGYAQYAAVPVKAAIPLPEELSPADGALVEPLTVSLYGVKLAAIKPGDRVLVLGGGTIALGAIYWARRFGAGNIVAMSRSPRRKELATAMGADGFVCYGENEAEEVNQLLGGPPDVVLECVGVPGYITKAIELVRLMGRVFSLGFCASPDPIYPAAAGFKGVSLQFPVGYSTKDFEYVALSMLKGHVDPKIMVSSEVSLTQFPSMFEKLLGPNNESKVLVVPTT